MGNVSPLNFAGGTIKQEITGNMKGSWDPDRSVVVLTPVGVPVEEALSDIRMNARIEVINL